MHHTLALSMDLSPVHGYVVIALSWMVLAFPTYVVLRWFPAPYGRHARRGWGPRISNRLGWFVMESPAVLVVTWLFVTAGAPGGATAVFFGLWLLHYVHRAWIYPFRRHGPVGRMPVVVMLFGVLFNVMNGALHGVELFTITPRPWVWLLDARFLCGALLFVLGRTMNTAADATLTRLRRESGGAYVVPQGLLFRRLSCPNYVGEIIQWTGWAVATWSLAGLSFAVWTYANLAPRAIAHHRWYREQFPDYPPKRNALLPF